MQMRMKQREIDESLDDFMLRRADGGKIRKVNMNI